MRSDFQAKLFPAINEEKLANSLGMGVGLLVAKTIIEAHGGRIHLECRDHTVLATMSLLVALLKKGV